MKKIASPADLQSELQALLAYSQDKSPSRAKIASDLLALADRVETSKTAAMERPIFETLKKAYYAGVRAQEAPDEAERELASAVREIQAYSTNLRNGSPHQPVFRGIAASLWEMAYWSGSLGR